MDPKRRRLIVRTTVLIVLIFAIGFTVYQIFHKQKVINVGDQAPNFVLTDLKGHKVQLKDYKGKDVVLNFWATWCDPCKREMPYINKVNKTLDKKNVVILAVNIKESKFAVSSFKDRYNISFPILLDPNGDVSSAYNIGPIPTTLFINKQGEVVDKLIESMPSAAFLEKKIAQMKQ